MTALRKLERDRFQADLAAVTGLLSGLHEEDVVARRTLKARVAALREAIDRLDQPGEEPPTASVALFFGGRPVVGAQGIESEFAGGAVAKFQDMVAKVLAKEVGALGQRGVVPNKGASTLHITNIARGSFGFLLEEINPQQPLMNTSLKTAVEETSQILDSLGQPDEEKFRTAVEDIDQRVLATAREFFELMRQNGATLRLVTNNLERAFDVGAVARAMDRATSTVVEDSETEAEAILKGVLPEGHQFEALLMADHIVVRGRVDRALTVEQVASLNKELDVPARARFRMKRVFRNGAMIGEHYTLLSLMRNVGG